MGARTSLACAASKFLVVARRCKPVLAVSGLVQVLVSTVVGVTRIPFSSDGSVYYQPGVDSVTEAARDANTLLSPSSFSPALTCRAHVSCLARSQEQTTQMVSACVCVRACVRACGSCLTGQTVVSSHESDSMPLRTRVWDQRMPALPLPGEWRSSTNTFRSAEREPCPPCSRSPSALLPKP